MAVTEQITHSQKSARGQSFASHSAQPTVQAEGIWCPICAGYFKIISVEDRMQQVQRETLVERLLPKINRFLDSGYDDLGPVQLPILPNRIEFEIHYDSRGAFIKVYLTDGQVGQ